MCLYFGLKNLSRRHPYFRERLYSMTFALNWLVSFTENKNMKDRFIEVLLFSSKAMPCVIYGNN